MMRPGLLTVLLAVSAGPLAAWEVPTQHELAALLGEEPQATILLCGLPQVPGRDEARKNGWRYEQERVAIKRALVFRTSRAKAARGRISPELNAATAQFARSAGAPEAFCTLLEQLAAGRMSRRREYAAEQALRQLVTETYGIDDLQIRLLSEALALPERRHLAFMLQLPVGGMFDLVSTQPTPQAQVPSDILTMNQVLRQAHEILRTVHDQRSADEAVDRLLALLPLWNTTMQTRYHRGTIAPQMNAAAQWAAQLLENTVVGIIETRRSLHEKGWYGSSCLEAVDELFR